MKTLQEELDKIFKHNSIRQTDRPGSTFVGDKYSVLDKIGFGNFISHYSLVSKHEGTKYCNKDQSCALPDELWEQKYQSCEYSNMVTFIKSKGKMKCWNVCRLRRYHVPK